MSQDTSLPAPSQTLPKGGGAIRYIDVDIGTVGCSGAATCEIALPISMGRSYVPALALQYNSSRGNGTFGLGWHLSLPSIARQTSQGIPAYNDDDLFIEPDGTVLLPDRDPENGALITSRKPYNEDKQLSAHTVVRYRPRVERAFDRIEHWAADDSVGFWRVWSADGTQHVYGKSPSARRVDPDHPDRVAEWLLEESMNAHGEHIVYEYATNTDPADTQRYLSHVRYGNATASSRLYSFTGQDNAPPSWHFILCFDYGERTTTLGEIPDFKSGASASERPDPFSDFRFGFELRTRRLCRQILMFHCFPDDAQMGKQPVLVRRTLLQYETSALACSLLSAVFNQAYGGQGRIDDLPPLEFSYSRFDLSADATRCTPFVALNSMGNQQPLQFVDLLGEGLPGVLQRAEKAWQYHAPTRHPRGGDRVDYVAQALPGIPLADATKPVRQFLANLTGNSRPDWLTLQPGVSGFFTLDAAGNWSGFTPFAAFPDEFFQPGSQLANLMGAGVNDLVMIGPRSVRLYANQRKTGFRPAIEVPRRPDDDDLPGPAPSQGELVAFSDVLGSGQQHLVRIRHNEVKCWPNLGRGRFGKGRVIAQLDFDYEHFDAANILLADLDGSGATDLIYLQADGARIFMNRFGNGLAPAIRVPWPEGLHFDRFCRVEAADLQGSGCSSLVIDAPGNEKRYWRYDFVDSKPYLLGETDNNMGAINSIHYRSSAQEWLDEKQERRERKQATACQLPFPLPVIKRQILHDEISGNRMTRQWTYRRGFYDPKEHEFRGFGLLEQTDSLDSPSSLYNPHTPPLLRKTWYHTGDAIDPTITDPVWVDKHATALKPAIQKTGRSWSPRSRKRDLTLINLKKRQREMAIALTGNVLREEIYGRDSSPLSNVPYSVQTYRYQLNELRGIGKHSVCSIIHPVLAESLRLDYERIADDPQCSHTLNLQWDDFGVITHAVQIRYARRKQASDKNPFTTDWEQQCWIDAHDDEQQFYFVQEDRQLPIHHDTEQARRLGLPYLQCSHALKLPKSPLPDGLAPADIHHDNLLELIGSARWKALRVMTSLSLTRYRKADDSSLLDDGHASVEALVDHVEIAEINDVALKAFDALGSTFPAINIAQRLKASGHEKMTVAPAPADTWGIPSGLWSVRRNYSTYYGSDAFFKPRTFQASRQHGATTITYDASHCLVSSMTLPDLCTTRTSAIDYRTLAATRLIDPNGIVRETRYDGFGQVFLTSHYKNASGFKPLALYKALPDASPATAINAAKKALQNAASAFFHAPRSWMGQVKSGGTVQEKAWRDQAIASGDLLPGGFIRASTRKRYQHLIAQTPYERYLKHAIGSAVRDPVHSAALHADRTADDSKQQIRITIASQDGYGRPLQSKQKTGAHWRVSAPVEYDNKGLAIRIFRPWFSDDYRYSNDATTRHSGLCDQQLYDPTGRLIRVINASGHERRYSYHPWYTLSEDENDTQVDELTDNTLSTDPGDES